MQPIGDLQTLLARMQPVLHPGRHVFSTLPAGTQIDPATIVACIREPEGLSVILADADARRLGLRPSFAAAWIALGVESDLAAVGFTAAFSGALARAGIGCNVVAGVRHDHLFVPEDQAVPAMAALHALQRSAAGGQWVQADAPGWLEPHGGSGSPGGPAHCAARIDPGGRPRGLETDPMKIESLSPVFSVTDLARSIDFYRHALGFDLAWAWGEPPDIAAVCRDGVEITLSQRQGAKPAGAAHVYLGVSDVDACYATVVDAGATVVVPIDDRPYGMRDFRIADPSGNELSIGQVIAGGGEP